MQDFCAPRTLEMNSMREEPVHHPFEELKNIENRVAWFLAELCKAEKGVQKDKRNQRQTELVRGLFV
jgi:hypothetical protein